MFYLQKKMTFVAGVILLSCFQASADWKQIGLAGSEVTALITDTLPAGDTILIAGTKSDGVWCRWSSTGRFLLLDDLGATKPSAFLMGIRNFYITKKNHRLYAGSDSGLAWYPLISLIEPRWTRVADVPNTAVTDITGTGDTLFCCIPLEVYRSLDGGTTWAACSARKVLPPLGNITSFTSLAFFLGVNAGSRFAGPINSWVGVLNSADWGKSWKDISLLPPQTQTVGVVYDLAGYRTGWFGESRLLAATGTGLQFLYDIDTGYWHPFDPQLKGMTPLSLCITYYTRSLYPDIFAAGDSGVYVFSDRFGSGWIRLFDRKTDCITSFRSVDSREWLAGTIDGVWQYSLTAGVISKGLKNVKRSPCRVNPFCATLDGKKLSAPASGMMIIDNGDKAVRLKP